MTIIPANTANKGCLVKLTKMTPDELLTFIEEDRANAEARGGPEPWKGVKEFLVREKEDTAKKTEAKARETREFLVEKAQVIAEHMYDVMKDENASIDLRRRAAEFIAEASMTKVAETEHKATETPAKVFTRKDMKRVNFLTGGGVAEAMNAVHKAVCAELRDQLNPIIIKDLKNYPGVSFLNEAPAEPWQVAKRTLLAEVIKQYRGDIALFAKQVFGAELTLDQIKFCEEFRTERTITRHEPPAWGKTYVAAIAVWWSLVCFDDVKVTIFGPNEFAIRNGIWGNLQGLHARMVAPFKDLFDVSATRISRKTDAPSCFAEYRLASADNASAARGIHAVNNFVFVDDADGVSEVVIAYLQNIMIDRNPKLCLLSTKMNVKFASLRDLKLYALANFTKSYPEDVAKLILNAGLYDEFTTMVQAKETW